MAETKVATVGQAEGIKVLQEVRQELRKVTRKGRSVGLNRFKTPSHIVFITHEGSYETIHHLILADQIDLVANILIDDKRVQRFTISELGRNVLEHSKDITK